MKKSHYLFADQATNSLLNMISDITGIEKQHLVGDVVEEAIAYLFHVSMLAKQADDMATAGFETDAAAFRVLVDKKFRRKFRDSNVSISGLGAKLSRYLQMHLKIYNRM